MPPSLDFALARKPSDLEGVTLLVASGDVDMTVAREFGSRLEDAVRRSDGSILLDLDRVEHLDSTALRFLLAARRLAEDRAAALVLVCSRRQVLRVLQVTGLDELFEIFPARDEALQAIGTRSEPK